jgi:hypothetical protein
MKRLLCLFLLTLASAYAQPAATERQYLSGHGSDDPVAWDFYCVSGRNSGFWTTIGVPSCWEQQGFGSYDYGYEEKGREPLFPRRSTYDQGVYRRTFTVPADWKGRGIRLVFEGVMTELALPPGGRGTGR